MWFSINVNVQCSELIMFSSKTYAVLTFYFLQKSTPKSSANEKWLTARAGQKGKLCQSSRVVCHFDRWRCDRCDFHAIWFSCGTISIEMLNHFLWNENHNISIITLRYFLHSCTIVFRLVKFRYIHRTTQPSGRFTLLTHCLGHDTAEKKYLLLFTWR